MPVAPTQDMPALLVLEVMKIRFVAAGPVSRILSATRVPRDGHSSGPRIAARL